MKKIFQVQIDLSCSIIEDYFVVAETEEGAKKIIIDNYDTDDIIDNISSDDWDISYYTNELKNIKNKKVLKEHPINSDGYDSDKTIEEILKENSEIEEFEQKQEKYKKENELQIF